MNIVLQYDPTEMLVSHHDDVSIHVVFTINRRRSELTVEEIDAYTVESHTIQPRTPHLEIQQPIVSHVVLAQEEQLKCVEQVNVTPLQEDISKREREVLELVAKGLSNQEIAEVLVLSVDTVKRHMSNIFSKLHVRNRMQAVVQAHKLGVLIGASVDTVKDNRAATSSA